MELLVFLSPTSKPISANVTAIDTSTSFLRTFCPTQSLQPNDYLIYCPAKPGKSKQAYLQSNDALSQYFQSKDSIHLRTKVVIGRILHISIDKSKGRQVKMVSCALALPIENLLRYACVQFGVTDPTPYALFLSTGREALPNNSSLIQLEISPDNLCFVLKDKSTVLQEELNFDIITTTVAISAPTKIAPSELPGREIKDAIAKGIATIVSGRKKLPKFFIAIHSGFFVAYKTEDDPKPTLAIPLKTFLIQTKPIKGKFCCELSVDEGAKGLNTYTLTFDDPAVGNSWREALENCLAASQGTVKPKRVNRKGPYFGIYLQEVVVNQDGSEIPELVEQGLRYIEQRALQLEGIFRLSGSAAAIKEYKAQYDANQYPDLFKETDPHVIAGLIKLYLRELPEPLLTYGLYNAFISMDSCTDKVLKVKFTRNLIERLPAVNRTTLSRLLNFALGISRFSSVNKMAIHNLATVFGPNLLRDAENSMMTLVEDTAHLNSITNFLIQDYNLIFESTPLPECSNLIAARANYDYVPPDSETLPVPFYVGSIINVIHQGSDGWWWGECDDNFGRFPGSYVVLLQGKDLQQHVTNENIRNATYHVRSKLKTERIKLSKIDTQYNQYMTEIEQLQLRKQQLEANSEQVTSTLRSLRTGPCANLPKAINELNTYMLNYSTRKPQLFEQKDNIQNELQRFSHNLVDDSSSAPTPKKLVRRDSRNMNELRNLRTAIGTVWNKFITEDMKRKQLETEMTELQRTLNDLDKLFQNC
eukprot:TRINITY_DN1363_c0_g1_i1.p1 TRINITY_DN1363_c0_g1~~TRINITY_DN1363_c0_g1_i1.p1  ORF type:complete len:760 (+),score=357.44 TRINITY_DN1363_c0_g1_i1:106-2385(+)